MYIEGFIVMYIFRRFKEVIDTSAFAFYFLHSSHLLLGKLYQVIFGQCIQL